MATQAELLQQLCECVLEMEDEKVVEVAQEYIDNGFDPLAGVLEGLVPGMQKAADLYEAEEYYIPELLICSDAMYNGLDIIRPHIPKENVGNKGKIVIGVVHGDTHDIGKNLVKIMLEAAGYEMFDMGRDVPLQNFVDKVKEVGADVLALSTLMSTAMPGMGELVKMLEAEGIRDQVKVIIGGAPISWEFCRKIGADGYSVSAVDAVKLVDDLMAGRPVGPQAE